VTRTDPAYGMMSVESMARVSGVIPQLEHPLEQPPPLQAAMNKTTTITTRRRTIRRTSLSRPCDLLRPSMKSSFVVGTAGARALEAWERAPYIPPNEGNMSRVRE
jgi:hypothetical protein